MQNFLQSLFGNIGTGIRNVVSGVGMGISNLFGGNRNRQPTGPVRGTPARATGNSRPGRPTRAPVTDLGKPQGPVEQGPRRTPSRRPSAFDDARAEANSNGRFGAPAAPSPFDQILADSANQAAAGTGSSAPSQEQLRNLLSGNPTNASEAAILEGQANGQSPQFPTTPPTDAMQSFAGGSETFQETGTGQQLTSGGVPGAPAQQTTPQSTQTQLDLLNSILSSQSSGTDVTQQLNDLASQNATLANQLSDQLGLPAPEPAPVQPGQAAQTGLSPTGSSVTPGQGPQQSGFDQAFLTSLVSNLQNAAVDGSLPFSVNLPGQASGGQAGGAGQTQQGTPGAPTSTGDVGQGRPGSQTGQGGTLADGSRTFNRPTRQEREPGFSPFRAPSTPAQSAAQQEASAAVARQAGLTDANGKPLAGFRPIVDSAGNPIILAPRGDTSQGTTDVQDIFDSFPVLRDFVDPIAFSVDSPFLGQFDLRQSDIQGQRLVTVPQVDANGNTIRGSTATIFADPQTQRQRDLNLAAQPEDTQRAFFAAQVENSGLAQTLRQANPPEQQPDPFQEFLNGFITSGLGGLGGAGTPAPAPVNESVGPPAFPGGPPTRIVEAAPLTPGDIGSGVDVGGALGGTSGLLQGQQGPDLAGLLSQLLNSSQPLG